MEAQKMNIFQRVAAITAELQTVGKNLNVDTGKGKSYKAVSERDVIDAVKPLEAKYGVYSWPTKRETVESERLLKETQYGTTTQFYVRIKTTYRFLNIDDPSDFFETEVYSVGLDSGDKGDGKANTYADKYCLMKAYKLSTGDDPDQQASQETYYSDVSRNTLLEEIYALDVTRKELDSFIASRLPGKDADTAPIETLKGIKVAIIKKRQGR